MLTFVILLGVAYALTFPAALGLGLVLARYDICFTFGIEGAAKMVVAGDNIFHHALAWWLGHRINDPRRGRGFDPVQPAWEILSGTAGTRYSLYPWWQLQWKFLEHFGVYWYGLWPFFKIYDHEFEWTEQEVTPEGGVKPRHRKEHTRFIFIKDFIYWMKISEAEDKDNFSLDLNYLLTLRTNNPYTALFKTDDWLGRITADANNTGKIFVGARSFNEIKTEGVTAGAAPMSQFAQHMCNLNTNLITEPGGGGAPKSYGVTVGAASLVTVDPSGAMDEQVSEALIAKRKAELMAEATIATAKGEAESVRQRAAGEADAIEKVYKKVEEFGELGIELQRLDTLKQASRSPGSNIIWANNPFGEAAGWFRRAFTSPAANSNGTPPSTP